MELLHSKILWFQVSLSISCIHILIQTLQNHDSKNCKLKRINQQCSRSALCLVNIIRSFRCLIYHTTIDDDLSISEKFLQNFNPKIITDEINIKFHTSKVPVSLTVSEKSSPSDPTFFASGDCCDCWTFDILSSVFDVRMFLVKIKEQNL